MIDMSAAAQKLPGVYETDVENSINNLQKVFCSITHCKHAISSTNNMAVFFVGQCSTHLPIII